MGKPYHIPVPDYTVGMTHTLPSKHLLEMHQAQAYLQAQVPSGVTVTQVERLEWPNGQYTWSIGVYVNALAQPVVITTLPSGTPTLPLQEIMNKANLLGA
jgi:hypothetical protein